MQNRSTMSETLTDSEADSEKTASAPRLNGEKHLLAMQSSVSAASRKKLADETVERLLRIQAVNFKGEPYFTLTSGKKSPVYVDCRKIISYPDISSFITNSACRLLAHKDFDAIAGGETAGIPFAAWIAAKMNKPMLYVRKKPKGFGLGARIEGVMPNGRGRAENKPRVLLVEDHATDGKSKISFVEALREAGATCNDAFVVFYYDIFVEAAKALVDKKITLHALATWRDALATAEQKGFLDSPDTARDVKAFLNNPTQWQQAHA